MAGVFSKPKTVRATPPTPTPEETVPTREEIVGEARKDRRTATKKRSRQSLLLSRGAAGSVSGPGSKSHLGQG